MPIKVVRIFNTYGPRMHPHDGRVVSNFIVQALKDEIITIYGDGSQTRSFCYVDDLVEAMLRMMDTPGDVTGPINIGNPNEFTIRELAEVVIELTGTKVRFSGPLLGRSAAASTRYCEGQGGIGMGTENAVAGWIGKDDRLFRQTSVGGAMPTMASRRLG